MHFSNCQVLRAKWRNGLNAAKHREMTNHKKNFIVATGASSGFGALAARALAVLLRAQQGSVGILPAPRCTSKPHSGV
jgi:hypothetical protein